MKRAIIILLTALAVLPAAAQEPRIQHRPYLDNRFLHYGFFIGVNMMDMELKNNGYVDPATGQMAEGIEAQTRQALRNIGAILAAAGLGHADIVKTTVLLADIADFAAMNAVYAEFFPTDKPARVCYQVATLPLGARVEIDAVAGR